jgi:hypothetical protein
MRFDDWLAAFDADAEMPFRFAAVTRILATDKHLSCLATFSPVFTALSLLSPPRSILDVNADGSSTAVGGAEIPR